MNKKILAILGVLCLVCVIAIAQNTANYNEQGGARTVIGGSIDVVSGGEIDIESGGAFKIDGTAVTATANDLNTGNAGPVARSVITEDALQAYGVFNDITSMSAYSSEPLGVQSDFITLKSGDIQNTTTTTDNTFNFVLPPEYVAAGDIRFTCYAKYAGSGTVGATKTIDVIAKKVTAASGALGSDICATNAITLTNSYAACTFTITATGLAAGDTIQFLINGALQETGNTDPIYVNVISPKILLDVKG